MRQSGTGQETSTVTLPEPDSIASFLSGGEIVQTPFSAPDPVAAVVVWVSAYVPPLSSLVKVDASAGGQLASSRHLPSLVWMAIGGSLTAGFSPLRNWP